ncbi:MAG: hypothetical protein Q9167_001569 [Letrouitia subvulpina]
MAQIVSSTSEEDLLSFEDTIAMDHSYQPPQWSLIDLEDVPMDNHNPPVNQNNETLFDNESVFHHSNGSQASEGVLYDDTGSESEQAEHETPQQPKFTARKKEQREKFEQWRLRNAEQIANDEIKTAKAKAEDETLSIRELMSKDKSHIISDPREYQMELFEMAKTRNIIAVLDTGSGKTLIAVLLLRFVIDRELENRARGTRPRIAFFLLILGKVDCVTLVFQQYAVLHSNLEYEIERFCGEMGCDLWARETWQKHFKENKIIVCTAEILYNCLVHSFITIDQINLLIFDEAHHAKKNHAYARIIKDFYLAAGPVERPKVFGMTASPVDARQDPVQAAKELEAMLHCQIATTSDLSLLRMSVSRPEEQIAVYAKLRFPYFTPLSDSLKARYPGLELLNKIFKFVQEATSELGEWCADQVWSFALAEQEAMRLERKIEHSHATNQILKPVEQLDDEIGQLRDAQAFVRNWNFGTPSFDGNSLSSKVILLHSYLRQVFERPSETRCIVFVNRRYTARLLGNLFSRIGPPHMRMDLLIGTRYGDPGDVKISFRQQVLTLTKFRKGELNCLFATSIAEEGLDIPDCNVVIRFDLYKTLIQYIQSRGRARHTNSKYIHMIEDHNRWHLQLVTDVRGGEIVMRRFCEALPADRLLQGNDYNFEGALAREGKLRKYIDPESGATLTYASSLAILAHFVSCLPDASAPPIFSMRVDNKLFVCEVVLPENSPIRSAIGRPSSKKTIAKRSAAFEACLLLRQARHLDSNLLPTYHKHLPAMRNAHLALNMNKASQYDMMVKPSLWKATRGCQPTALFMTVMELDLPENLGRDSQPLALLTRTRLPDFPPILLHLQPDKTSNVVCKSMVKSLLVPGATLSKFTSFTLRIYKDIFNKKFEKNEPEMSYWLVPVNRDRPIRAHEHDVEGLIDWEVLDYVDQNTEWKWTIYEPNSSLENRYLVDKWDGGRRFYSSRVVPGLRALDPVPEDAAAHKYMKSIIDYSVSLYPRAREKAVWLPEQPVIAAHRIMHRLNWLDEFSEQQKQAKSKAYVCPEPLLFSARKVKHLQLPVSVAAMGYLFPAVLTRLESYLVALEACDVLGLTVQPHLALEAITKDSDNTSEHREQQIHVQKGMGKNYERLEFLGDCFLKMATSISIFCISPENNEFEYHVRRMLLICNKNLFNNAVSLGLYKYIRSMGFSRRMWYPEGIKLLEGKGSNATNTSKVFDSKGSNAAGETVQKHTLSDKTIADVCEALIGAALLSYRSSGNMDMAAKAVTSLVCSEDHNIFEWADYYKLYSKPTYQTANTSASQLYLAEQIEKKLGYHFKYPRLLFSAFVHSSIQSYGDMPCYQRLEFLGDALLDMACVNFLFYRHPDRDPQWLTEHKMAMVSNKFLGALSVKLGFQRFIRFSGQTLEWQNREFVQEVEEAERESEGAPDYWTTVKMPPKCLSDVVESYLGAVFVDSEFDFHEIEKFFEAHIRWYFEDMSIYDTFANHHPVTHLHKLLTLSLGCSNYSIMASNIISASGMEERGHVAVVMVHGDVVANGTASSGKIAKVKASAKALKLLTGLIPADFREQYKCDCKDSDAAEVEVGGGGTAV